MPCMRRLIAWIPESLAIAVLAVYPWIVPLYWPGPFSLRTWWGIRAATVVMVVGYTRQRLRPPSPVPDRMRPQQANRGHDPLSADHKRAIGRRVLVVWDRDYIGKHDGAMGTVIAASPPSAKNEGILGGDLVLVELWKPVNTDDGPWEYLVAGARRYGLDSLLPPPLTHGHNVWCGFIRVAPERAHGPDPCDVSWWRGGAASLGSLVYDADPISVSSPHA